jgi:hypothetical protein
MTLSLNTNQKGLVRDLNTKVLINKNMDQYEAILKERNRNTEINMIKNEVEMLKLELKNIKLSLEDIGNIVRK